jgi:uncharacterized protein
VSTDVTPREETAEHFIDSVEHPAARSGQTGTLSAGRVVALVVVALLTATLLNSEGLVRAGEGMQPGLTRSMTLGVARPIDRLAQSLGLSKPHDALAAALGQEDLSGGEIVDDGGPAIVVPLDPGPDTVPRPAPSAPPQREVTLRTPTKEHPLRVLVTGDSLATYVGMQLTNITNEGGLVDVSLLDRNGTGLTNPSVFNWQKAARTDMARLHPDVVIMIIGGNDGWPMDTPEGDRVQVGTTDWVDEYARRTAAVMRTFGDGGRAVYWSGPPTARANGWDTLYRKINRADRAAAAAIPGAQYVDLYGGTAVNGAYADYVADGGKNVKARQSDGVHWSFTGAHLPARLLLEQLEADADVDLR